MYSAIEVAHAIIDTWIDRYIYRPWESVQFSNTRASGPVGCGSARMCQIFGQ